MRRVVLLPLLLLLGANAGGGAVTGKVTMSGSGSAWVYVEDLSESAPEGAQVKGPLTKMAQKDKQFAPQVIVVQRGTRVEFPNADPIFHNVFSVTPGTTFDLGGYPQGESRGVTMNRPGQVNVFCNIHPQMIGTILVVPGPHYVQVGADGSYRLTGLPPGKHKIVAWTAEAKPVTQEVDVPDGGEAKADFTLKAQVARTHLRKDGTPYGSYNE